MQMNLEKELDLLHEVLACKTIHARFLNTLSYMELVGAQKLSRLVRTFPGETFFLEHIAEEYRHSFYLRHLANKLATHSLENFNEENIFCKRESRAYIHTLEREICLILKSHNYPIKTDLSMVYWLTTLVIEERALVFYKHYQLLLDEYTIGISVKSVISEEEHHLSQMHKKISEANLSHDLIASCFAKESEYFFRWIDALMIHCKKTQEVDA